MIELRALQVAVALRLVGFTYGVPGLPMLAALAMELLVTPALCVWQGRVAKQFARVALRQGPLTAT